MKRRDFLQMLGIGATDLVIETTAFASPIVPLFLGNGSEIWTPEYTDLTRSHLVLTRPGAIPWESVKTPSGTDPTVPRMRRESWPTLGNMKSVQENPSLSRRGHVLCHLDWWGDNPPAAVVGFGEGQDPHHAFYRAAMKMREDFAKESQRRILEIPVWRRPHSVLVTLVDTPIFASVMPLESGREQLLCEISYTPYVVDASDEINLNGWQVYSENGEYPIEVPSQIDMDFLLSVDCRIARGEMTASAFGDVVLVG